MSRPLQALTEEQTRELVNARTKVRYATASTGRETTKAVPHQLVYLEHGEQRDFAGVVRQTRSQYGGRDGGHYLEEA